jgi:hypothetical protein
MSRSVKILVSVLTVLVVAGLISRLYNFLSHDALARFKVNPTLGIQMNGVSVKQYKGNKLVGKAKVDRVDVHQDHELLDFFGVHDGLFATQDGPVTFQSQAANYNSLTRQLTVNGPSHVTAKGLDANATSFMFDQDSSIGTMPGVATGKLAGGIFTGKNLTFNSKTGGYHLEKIYWDGVPPSDTGAEVLQTPQDKNAPAKTRWHISGEVEFNNGIATYTDIRADDGEILVTAPKGVHDQHSDVLTLTGPVYYYSEKANCVCDKAVIYRKEKRAVLTGHVHMLVKPKDQEKLQVGEIPPWRPPVPDSVAASRPAAPQSAESQQEKDLDDELRSSKTSRKYPAHIRADEVTYWYAKGSRHAIIKGSPDCYQEFPGGRWRRVVTHEALYDGEKDEMTLVSTDGTKDTRMVDSLGDDLVAKKFVVSTKEDDEKYSGDQVDGIYSSDDEDLPQVKNGGNGSTPAAPTTAPAQPVMPPPTTPAAPPKAGP